MRALRLPTCVSAVTYFVRFRCPPDPPALCPPKRSWRVEGLLPARALGAGCPYFRLLRVDANGISQVSRRSLLCLCSAPRPRSNRCALAMAVTSMLPPLPIQRRLRTIADFGAHSRSFSTCSPSFAFRVATHAQGWLPAGWLAFTGRASNPLDRDERFQIVEVVPLSCSPDANGFRFAQPILRAQPAVTPCCRRRLPAQRRRARTQA